MSADRDPVVVWLEEIRDFAGATERAREMAQQAIDRLAAAGAAATVQDPESPAPESTTADTKIDRIVEESRKETERGRQARRQP